MKDEKFQYLDLLGARDIHVLKVLPLWDIEELVNTISIPSQLHFSKWVDIFALVYKVIRDYVDSMDELLQPLVDEAMLSGYSCREEWISGMLTSLWTKMKMLYIWPSEASYNVDNNIRLIYREGNPHSSNMVFGLGPSMKRADLSLQIRPRHAGFGSSRKYSLHSPGPTGGFLRALSFIKKAASSDGGTDIFFRTVFLLLEQMDHYCSRWMNEKKDGERLKRGKKRHALLITYQDKATQTDIIEEDTLEKIFNTLTTLSMKVDSMGNEIEKLKTNEVKLKSIATNQLTQQCAELCRSEDIKIPELEGDVGTLHKTHNIYQSTSAGQRYGLVDELYVKGEINSGSTLDGL
ncbi:RINT1-like protein MAG2 [Capsicum baccatum]|uniref:RINT1-like protein MAG2 n=1 Tax=Capsicum baccatum TaxID=33114 RepID=A0A2G2WS96_CAPBA|nr:RINT1-like protein MAG2 [Capsicum baccatum]